ncbi:17750_t:CDS:2 [Gigaspora margarita]|uniref:17750_t:CDS:1 n=1 Tax=Gigaspora margarita TaxID=4874 RepID=A0ABM8W119_GIGMA|nr:17750_t:CDS:2 [Gigaspora margarita]
MKKKDLFQSNKHLKELLSNKHLNEIVHALELVGRERNTIEEFGIYSAISSVPSQPSSYSAHLE